MVLGTAQQIAARYSQSIRKNNYTDFTLESNDNPDIDYYGFSGYVFKNTDQDEFEKVCQDKQVDWQSDILQCPDCENDWDYCSCNDDVKYTTIKRELWAWIFAALVLLLIVVYFTSSLQEQ